MNLINLKALLLLFLFVYNIGYTQEKDSNTTVDPVASFKEYITKHFKSYETNKRFEVAKLGGGWAKQFYKPKPNYTIDVQKTNSLITPYTGVCEFKLTRYYTKFHATKSSAAKDSSFVKSDTVTHKHHYGFQDGKWVVTSRSFFVSILEKWFDCNEQNSSGETNLYKCWEIDNQ